MKPSIRIHRCPVGFAGALTALFIGCATNVAPPLPIEQPGDVAPLPAARGLIGTWQVDEPGLLSFLGDFVSTPMYVAFRPDGNGRVHSFDARSGSYECQPFNFVDLEVGVQIGSLNVGSLLMLYDIFDEAQLELVDSFGARALLTRTEGIPAELQCGSVEVVNTIETLPERPHYATGLAYQGVILGQNVPGLWYTGDSRISYAVNPETGELVTTSAFSEARYVQAAEGISLWNTCNCGSDIVQRRTHLNGLIDDIEHFRLPDVDFSTGAAAFDSVNNELWVSGTDHELGGEFIKRINAQGEPDVVVATLPATRIEAMSSFDGRTWALKQTGTILEIDRATGKTLKAFEAPKILAEWHGIAVVGDRVFLIGEREGLFDSGILVEARLRE